MKLYIIKRKGSFYWGNLLRNLRVKIAEKEFFCDMAFGRKKDAKEYFEQSVKEEHREYYEIVPLILAKKEN